ncbi:MAG: hypothetical protein HC933_00030 [Pleurocapsa sp. SU_196_0]|nr:hypothetical protein [Pleurocapsa sp. SU_196_0]
MESHKKRHAIHKKRHAIHEAGHVVVAISFGWVVKSVDIKDMHSPNWEEIGGTTTLVAPNLDAAPTIESKKAWNFLYGVQYAAGCAAESLLLGNFSGGEADFRELDKLGLETSGNLFENQRLHYVTVAKAILQQNMNFQALNWLSDELEEKEILNQAEIFRILIEAREDVSERSS